MPSCKHVALCILEVMHLVSMGGWRYIDACIVVFGIPPAQITFFQQGSLPCLDESGGVGGFSCHSTAQGCRKLWAKSST